MFVLPYYSNLIMSAEIQDRNIALCLYDQTVNREVIQMPSFKV